MIRKLTLILLFALSFATLTPLYGQQGADSLKARLDTLARHVPELNSVVDISVARMPLGELFRSIARSNSINITVKPGIEESVAANFVGAKVTDVLTYLITSYNLQYDIVGSIISVSPRKEVPIALPKATISYNSDRKTVTYSLNGEYLASAMERFSSACGVNVIVSNALGSRKAQGFGNNQTPAAAVKSIAAANDMEVYQNRDSVWVFSQPTPQQNFGGTGNTWRQPSAMYGSSPISVDSLGRVTINGSNLSIGDVVVELCNKLKKGYYFFTPLTGQVNLYLSHVPFDDLLNAMLEGTKFSFKLENGYYVFGDKNSAEVFDSQVIQLKYRTVDKLDSFIPNSIREGLQIQTFADQNSFIVSGSGIAVRRFTDFVKQIDKVVPLVTIEVMIVDVSKSSGISTGIEAGLGQAAAKTTGSISPGVDMKLSTSSINSLINGFNGFGVVKIGKVTPDFYLNIKALEEAGNIDIKSTPKLSTLNGHEATLKNGQTKYYKEVNNNYFGTQNPLQSTSYTWKEIKAEFELKITPIVSGDEQITLNIEITQGDFTPREYADSPPGTTNRSFKSQVRIRNEEMVLLGGLERISKSDNSKGLPFLARIPGLKWLFGSNSNSKAESKVNFFIKPTIIY
ncbi:type II secretion system protein GspD [uncultured Acetobacteroides sp.]|uniref:type II secretion system protein GspD n=1 Tax=uncultured Acetobacteroides sp. TaxID=1760811 RepID=UPI0029F5BD16|nr:type II secretion system protein GspD [uncultured Acetobacteroides sp.]